MTVASRYLVATDGAQVGGDWYDMLPLPDGAVGLAVGDVVGHDLRAAARWGSCARLRLDAWGGRGRPRSSTAATTSTRGGMSRWPPSSTPAWSATPTVGD